jgi:polyhydroxyalkanoate synthase
VARELHAAVARFTAGLSPAALAHAYLDWVTHLTYAPGKRLQLVDKAARIPLRGGRSRGTVLHRAAAARQALRRGRLAQMAIQSRLLLHQQWWHNATTGIRGVTKQH